MLKWRSIKGGVPLEGDAVFFNPSFVVAFYRGGAQIVVLRQLLIDLASVVIEHFSQV